MKFTAYVVPMGKPRMTRRDKWAKRPCVVAYRAWADAVRLAAGPVPDHVGVLRLRAYMPIPKSLPAHKRPHFVGSPHQRKPDLDNIVKALMDALLPQDQGVYHIEARKVYDDNLGPRIEVELA